jgi:hypothetical protein
LNILESTLFLGSTLVNSDRPSHAQTGLAAPTAHSINAAPREDFSDYVAHLQLHMGLHSRRLTRPLIYGGDRCDQMIQQSQADLEKQASRQI